MGPGLSYSEDLQRRRMHQVGAQALEAPRLDVIFVAAEVYQAYATAGSVASPMVNKLS